MKRILIAAALLGATSAEAQKVVPPKTVYWMSAATQSGFAKAGAPSASEMMKQAMGGGTNQAQRTLTLDLGSKLPPSGPPKADHLIPPGMSMGASLPLKTPKPGKLVEEPGETPPFERPKGRLLIFWGCGETARAGQPVVFDFAKAAAGQIPPGLFGADTVRFARPPSAGTWPTYGFWPNDDKTSTRTIPSNASLIGDHKVSGTYTPDISFALQQDWMAPLALRQVKTASGSIQLSWNGVPGATGHFAQMIGGGGNKDDATLVFWSSSETQTFLSALADYVSPGEAARLVSVKKLMPPAQTSCTIPKEVMAAVQGGLVNLVSHGPEVNIVYPPKPKDPKATWMQDWSVKARFVTRTGAMAGMDMADMGGGATASGKPRCQPDAGKEVGAAAGGVAGAAAGGRLGGYTAELGKALGGMLGSKKKKAQDCEP